MKARQKGSGVGYVRRSTGKQEASLREQVQWIEQRAAEDRVQIRISFDGLENAMGSGVFPGTDIFYDSGISGSVNNRPGLDAMFSALENDASISHFYCYHTDRMGRPHDPREGVLQDLRLDKLGMTVRIGDRLLSPDASRNEKFVNAVTSLLGQTQSGQYLYDMADRVVRFKQSLAKSGFWAGGQAPYGFERYLLSPDGQLTLLKPRQYIRQAGCHVVILPTDREKIAVRLHVLELREKGWSYGRIAAHLDKKRIPSPNAGKLKTIKGLKCEVSSTWNQNTIKSFCTDPIVTGVLRTGVRSEGTHRRFGEDGPREVEEHEYVRQGVGKVVRNADEVVIKAIATKFDPLFPAERFEEIQELNKQRGRKQRGIPRPKHPERYPLNSRVIDLTCGCGSVMEGVPSSSGYVYRCRRGAKGGSKCRSFKVDRDGLHQVVLKSIRSIAGQFGNRDKLRETLLKIAKDEADNTSTVQLKKEIAELDSEIKAGEARLEQYTDSFAATTSESLRRSLETKHTDLARQLDELREEFAGKRRNLEWLQTSQCAETEVDKALSMLDQIERLADDDESRLELRDLMGQLDAWVGLRFKVVQPKKRKLLKLIEGMICFGGYRLSTDHYHYAGAGKAEKKTLLRSAMGVSSGMQTNPSEQDETIDLSQTRMIWATKKSTGSSQKNEHGGVRCATDDAGSARTLTPGGEGAQGTDQKTSTRGEGNSRDVMNRGDKI